MKKVVSIAIAAALAAVLFFAASPYWALAGLRGAIDRADSASLEERVDFPALRESLAAEINAELLGASTEELDGNPFGALALGLASKLVDGVIDSVVTPAGLARIARGDSRPVEVDRRNDPRSDRRPSQSEPPPSPKESDLFAGSRLEHETLDRFSVWVPNDRGDEARFVFRRRGFSWVLTGIELPPWIRQFARP